MADTLPVPSETRDREEEEQQNLGYRGEEEGWDHSNIQEMEPLELPPKHMKSTQSPPEKDSTSISSFISSSATTSSTSTPNSSIKDTSHSPSSEFDMCSSSSSPSLPSDSTTTTTTSSPSFDGTRSTSITSTPSSSPSPSSPPTVSDETAPRSVFDCNICLEQPEEPVITLCGHLFCWSCLYRWLELHPEYQTCPVCKAGVSSDKVIPLYGRGQEEKDPRLRRPTPTDQTQVPRRPQGQRTEPVHQGFQNGTPFGFFPAVGTNASPFHTQMGNFSFSAGFSIFPSLLGLQFVNQPFHTSGGGLGTGVPGSVPGTGGRGGGIGGLDETLAMTAEQQQQAFLSRMLFMLGTIVVVFLLLFN